MFSLNQSLTEVMVVMEATEDMVATGDMEATGEDMVDATMARDLLMLSLLQ